MECKKNSAMESGAKQTDLKVALADFKEEKEIEATSIEEIYLNDRELFESFRKLIRFSS